MLGSWKSSYLTINLYQNKLVVQGKKTSKTAKLVGTIGNIEGLSPCEKDVKKLLMLNPLANAIICDTCETATYTIEAKIKGSDIEFINGCGHSNLMRPPFKVLNTRILPDLNIIIANSLSRSINLGFFKDFEIVLPDFLLYAIDNYLGKAKKKGATSELTKLKELEIGKQISILNLPSDSKFKDLSKEDFEKSEDDVFLEIANMSNSILVTTDKFLKAKTLIKNRPAILFSENVDSHLKFVEKIRLGNET